MVTLTFGATQQWVNVFGKKTSDKVVVVDKGESNTDGQPAEVSGEQALQSKALDLVD